MNEEEELNNLITSLKVCPKCKKVINGDEKYCQNCGNNLSENKVTQVEDNTITNNTTNNTTNSTQIGEEPTPYYRIWGAIIGLFSLTYLVALFFKEVVDYGGRDPFIFYLLTSGISIGWIGGIIGYIIGYKIDINIMQEYQLQQQEIRKRQYEEEHSPEKEKLKRDQELQDSIDLITPFKNLEEAKDYHISAISWEQNENESFKNVNVILKNDKTGKMKNLMYNYEGQNTIIEVPIGATAYAILNIKRQQIYNLIEDGNYEEATEVFKEVFRKDPYTGKDIVINK